MLWVRAEYASPLAIIFAWLGALLPWNVTYAPDIAGGRLLFLRFPLFQVRFAFGLQIADPVVIHHPLAAIAFQAGRPLELAYQVWAVGAVLVGLAVVLSVVMYLDDTPPTEQRVDPVRLMGAILTAAALVLTAASALLYARGFDGPSIPVGVVLLYAFGLVLLLMDRVEGGTEDVTAAA